MKARNWLAFAVIGWAACSPVKAETAGPATTRRFVKKTVHPGAAIRVLGGAGFHQLTNSPHEWGRGAGGFGKRVASGFGGLAVRNGIQYSVAYVRHEELGYERSSDPRFSHRLEHALLATVITRKTTTGEKTVAAGKISGAVGSGLVSRLWMPVRLRTVSSGLTTAGISLGVDAGINVTREFWPRHRSR